MNQFITSTLGIDISKKKFDVALHLPSGEWRHKAFTNNREGFQKLTHWLNQLDVEQTHACMEASNVYGNALAEYLYDQNHKVSVVNPTRIKGFAQSELLRIKNDKQDAALIARFCESLLPDLWQPEPLSTRQLKAMVRRLDMLIDMRQQEVNRLDVSDEVVQGDIHQHIKELEQRINNIRSEIEAHINLDPDLKRKKKLLLSIPGIGAKTMATVLSYFSAIHKFASAKKLASFCGVAPREYQSGTSIKGRGPMSKIGSAHLRKSLFLPAMVALKYNPALKGLKERLSKKGKTKMLIIGAAMRKLIHIIYGVLKSNEPFDKNKVFNA
ncbi:IS110 family transposase [Marinomonas mediterranea]|uniref:IS110 family transposase n=1 Tax=Marinomonas mediterranea TaxID=119864 RepID=UPI002349C913|nr:IS110 family transposase [Marinomonas mediterranea]WCN07811.1 IS110 family transposase [Marinomonas mediterranea]